MPLDHVTREQARWALLRYLDAASVSSPGRGIPTPVLRQHLIAEGFRPDLAETESLCRYLEGKRLVERAEKPLSPEVADWRITADGQDAYAARFEG